MKILFQGDSITDAYRQPEEFNEAFRLGNGYVFLIASQLAYNYPQLALQFVNRGKSGSQVSDLALRWEEDALAINPDVLSLLVGVNNTIQFFDRTGGMETENFLSVYRGLLLALKEQNESIRYVVMEPFLIKTGRVTNEWINHIEGIQEGIRHIAQEFGAVHIPLQGLFDLAQQRAPAEYWSFDGIHATHAGFQLIANAWLQAALPIIVHDASSSNEKVQPARLDQKQTVSEYSNTNV